MARLWIWYPVRYLIGLIPVTASIRLFNLMGDLHLLLFRSRLKRLSENIRRGLPQLKPVSMKGILRTYLRNHYLDRLHIFMYPGLKSPETLKNLADLEGIEHLESALERGKGAIVVLGHYGPIQLPLFALGQAGYEIVQIGLPTDQGLSWIGKNVAFRLRMKYEQMIPARIIPANTFLRPVFKHLKSRGVVMMNIDPAGGGNWIGRMVWYHFFGQEIPFPMGYGLLAEKTGAPVLTLSIARIPGGRYRFTLHPALPSDLAAMEITSYVSRWYEDIVMKDPGLWHFWDEFEPGKLIKTEN